jgi:UDP-N-acetyl-D-mannosaminuronic acid dehydrogenase
MPVSNPLGPRIVVVGGCGHVGLPLGIAFASRGASVVLHDLSESATAAVADGRMPFDEPGAQPLLDEALSAGLLRTTTDPAAVADADVVIVVIGTPVDEHLNPDPSSLPRALEGCLPHLRDGQLVVLRSTVYPGVTALVEQLLASRGLAVDVAFCPERIAEGKAMTELFSLPQIVSARSERVLARAEELFGLLAPDSVRLEPEEAELAKLFTNAWRYLKFAAVNQFYMIADSKGLDFSRIHEAVVRDYPRAADMPGAGYAAGPCLFKDTMQLAAFNDNNFQLGHAAMLVNEGLPLHVLSQLDSRVGLAGKTVGILGMAFKAGSDDTRSSLSYKIKRILGFRAGAVLCTDPYVTTDPDLVPLDQVLAEADVLVVGAPHPAYQGLAVRQPFADVWGVLKSTES